MERLGLEKWRIAKVWESFSYMDEPRSYYDKEKVDVIFYGQNKKIGRPSAKDKKAKK